MNIESLRAQLAEAKQSEAEAKRLRIDIEKQVVDQLRDELKEQGTTNTHGLKIVTGYTRKWDQQGLRHLLDTGIPPDLFPFKTEYKEDKKMSDYLAQNKPDVWDIVSKSLTLTPRKPTVSIIEEKE